MLRDRARQRELWALLRDGVSRGGGPLLPAEAGRHGRGGDAAPAVAAPQSPAAIRDLAGRSAVALRRWQREPRDEDAMAEGVRSLVLAAEAARDLRGPDGAARVAEAVGRATRFGPGDAPVVAARALASLEDPPAKPK